VKNLQSKTREFAALLRAEFASEIERDPRGFKRSVLGFLKAALPPGPGRPRTEPVTHATEMRAHGKPWQQIYAQCIPASLTDDSRQVAERRLR